MKPIFQRRHETKLHYVARYLWTNEALHETVLTVGAAFLFVYTIVTHI